MTKKFPKEELFSLTSQIHRAALSVLLNIAEGSDRKSDIEFIRFLRISHSSLQEVVSASYIALDQKYLQKEGFNIIYTQSHQIAKKLNSLIASLKNASPQLDK